MEAQTSPRSYLQDRIEALKLTRSKLHKRYYIWFTGAIAVGTIIPVFAWASDVEPEIAALLLCYIIIPAASAFHLRSEIKDTEAQIKETGFELDLQSFQRNEIELKAEKTLRLSDVQLERYYGLNLSQNANVFLLGIGCIIAGLLIAAASVYAVIFLAKPVETQIITGVLGAISSLLVNYVAAVYLKLHASAAAHFEGFHTRLVQTHQILLAGVVASRIQDTALREKTLADLSLKVINK